MQGIDLIVFDCDGVLVDSEVIACHCLGEMLARYGTPTGLDEIFARFLGRSFAAVESHYQRLHGRPLPDSFRDELRALQIARFARDLKVMPGVPALLATLGRPYCLASSSDPERIRITLEATGLGAYFGDRVYNAAMVKRGKPAPDLFLHAAAAMGAAPAATLVVEDTAIGVEAGKAAGMTVWGFIGGSHYAGRDGRSALAAAGADRVFDSMLAFWPEPEG
jgi:HAD superfamily hydrolase (TIGR01509 family)